ncbi:MAG TPA: hypothetical protein VNI77_07485 [Nitrososphaera sp.]|nr:hypothetical protein [Nitrososphaera sp.]
MPLKFIKLVKVLKTAKTGGKIVHKIKNMKKSRQGFACFPTAFLNSELVQQIEEYCTQLYQRLQRSPTVADLISEDILEVEVPQDKVTTPTQNAGIKLC